MITKTQNQKNFIDYYGFTKTEQKKYPVVTGILKQLTPERIEKELKEIQEVKLPPEIQKWIKEYEKVGKRNIFFWQWIYKAIKETSFSVMAKNYQSYAWKSEFLIVMFIVILDEAIDEEKNKKLLDQLLKIPFMKSNIKFNKLNKKEKLCLNFSIKVWRRIEQLIKIYPRYREFKEIFKYDINQMLNGMEYDCLIDRNRYLINKTEYWLYSPHTMRTVVAITINLMCFSKFSIDELGIVREISLRIQKMARIGNWVSTWEREIKDNDFTSGVFAYAIESGVIMHNELGAKNQLKLIKKIRKAKIEKKILKDWERYYLQISKDNKKIRSIDIDRSIFGTKKLLTMYLITRGII